MSRKIDLTNKRFGKLLVIGQSSNSRNGRIYYECKCDCGNTSNVAANHLSAGKIKSCGCGIPKKDSHYHWSGIGELSGNVWNKIRRGASPQRRKPIKFNITKEYIWDLFNKQNGKCALTGIELKFPTNWKDKAYNASLDRIDSGEGYIEGNVQWVHKDINIMKNRFSQEYFIKMCTLVRDQCTIQL